MLGCGTFNVKFNKFHRELPLTVVSRDLLTLLGLNWFEYLRLGVTGINTITSNCADDLIREFQDVFSLEFGKYVGTLISFSLNPNITPIHMKPWRVPLALKPKIDLELDKLISQGILESCEMGDAHSDSH